MKIKKSKLDKLIKMTRDYHNGGLENLSEKNSKRMSFSVKEFGSLGCAMFGMMGDIIGRISPKASNEDIYKVFEILGYEVTE